MHGTGTPLGDPIEVGAASAVLQGNARSSQDVALVGTLDNAETTDLSFDSITAHCVHTTGGMASLRMTATKSRLGHAEPAAGAVGITNLVNMLSQAASHAVTSLRHVRALSAASSPLIDMPCSLQGTGVYCHAAPPGRQLTRKLACGSTFSETVCV